MEHSKLSLVQIRLISEKEIDQKRYQILNFNVESIFRNFKIVRYETHKEEA